ncbi:calcyclin-binding protein [Sciurus carolinensis]|uniref:calcyclin-binding protein n=1 Tax=Sciurus carolinensis TaxID=30640 RepID=UPI001FB26412|nr:calcyclin-binding protein [Sciurus carolinensis]
MSIWLPGCPGEREGGSGPLSSQLPIWTPEIHVISGAGGVTRRELPLRSRELSVARRSPEGGAWRGGAGWPAGGARGGRRPREGSRGAACGGRAAVSRRIGVRAGCACRVYARGLRVGAAFPVSGARLQRGPAAGPSPTMASALDELQKDLEEVKVLLKRPLGKEYVMPSQQKKTRLRQKIKNNMHRNHKKKPELLDNEKPAAVVAPITTDIP